MIKISARFIRRQHNIYKFILITIIDETLHANVIKLNYYFIKRLRREKIFFY